MSIEPTKPLYTGDIVLGDATELPGLTGVTRGDAQMEAAHIQGIVAIQSVAQRVQVTTDMTKELALAMESNMGEIRAKGKQVAAECDPNEQLDRDLIHFTQLAQAAVADVYLKAIPALMQRGVQIAASDVRRAITPPPPSPPPAPVIVQRTGPKMRESRGIEDWGKQKYVRDE